MTPMMEMTLMILILMEVMMVEMVEMVMVVMMEETVEMGVMIVMMIIMHCWLRDGQRRSTMTWRVMATTTPGFSHLCIATTSEALFSTGRSIGPTRLHRLLGDRSVHPRGDSGALHPPCHHYTAYTCGRHQGCNSTGIDGQPRPSLRRHRLGG